MSASIRIVNPPVKAGVYQAIMTLVGSEDQRHVSGSVIDQEAMPVIGPWKIGRLEQNTTSGAMVAFGLKAAIEKCVEDNENDDPREDCGATKGVFIRPGKLWPHKYSHNSAGQAPTHVFAWFVLEKDLPLPAGITPTDIKVTDAGQKRATLSAIEGVARPDPALVIALGSLGITLMNLGGTHTINQVVFEEVKQADNRNLTKWALDEFKKESSSSSNGSKSIISLLLIAVLVGTWLSRTSREQRSRQIAAAGQGIGKAGQHIAAGSKMAMQKSRELAAQSQRAWRDGRQSLQVGRQEWDRRRVQP